jgi:hypothetical protein
LQKIVSWFVRGLKTILAGAFEGAVFSEADNAHHRHQSASGGAARGSGVQAGALGHLGKACVGEDYIRAVEAALRGARYITAAVAEQLATHAGRGHGGLPHQALSNRE